MVQHGVNGGQRRGGGGVGGTRTVSHQVGLREDEQSLVLGRQHVGRDVDDRVQVEVAGSREGGYGTVWREAARMRRRRAAVSSVLIYVQLETGRQREERRGTGRRVGQKERRSHGGDGGRDCRMRRAGGGGCRLQQRAQRAGLQDREAEAGEEEEDRESTAEEETKTK